MNETHWQIIKRMSAVAVVVLCLVALVAATLHHLFGIG